MSGWSIQIVAVLELSTLLSIGFSRGLLNRQFWMLWILQQFCAGDDEDTSSEEEEAQVPTAKPAAGAEAAEKERDLHAEVGWGGSGKWQVAWFVNSIRRGGWKTPNRREKVETNLCFGNHCQLIGTQPAFQVFSQLDSYNPHHLPKKESCESEAQRVFSQVFLRIIQGRYVVYLTPTFDSKMFFCLPGTVRLKEVWFQQIHLAFTQKTSVMFYLDTDDVVTPWVDISWIYWPKSPGGEASRGHQWVGGMWRVAKCQSQIFKDGLSKPTFLQQISIWRSYSEMQLSWIPPNAQTAHV